MARAGDNTGEKEGSVYQPSLQNGLGGSQANEMDASSVANNATTIVEESDNPALGRHGRGSEKVRI
jgi:hypothetical protein